jgi:hypothetical protein
MRYLGISSWSHLHVDVGLLFLTNYCFLIVQVRVMFGRAALTFWFQVSKHLVDVDAALVPCQA